MKKMILVFMVGLFLSLPVFVFGQGYSVPTDLTDLEAEIDAVVIDVADNTAEIVVLGTNTDFVAADTVLSNALLTAINTLQAQVDDMTNSFTSYKWVNPYGTNSYSQWISTTQRVERLYDGGVETNIYLNLIGE